MSARRADAHLAASDPVLARVVAETRLAPRTSAQEPYQALLRAVLAQQVSKQAADAIERRFLDLFPRRRPTPAALLRTDPERLREVGLSRQKAGYVTAVAEAARGGRLARGRLEKLDDEAVLERLTAIRGIGRWTAEMVLIFSLDRPDVFPADDVGIERAMERLYPLPPRGRARRAAMRAIAAPWSPWRSRACRYLWAWRRNAPT
ncbi:MAG: DNA-3-methyladenine glycosylase 2 family protein [Gammaproteobacteria bacterium]|nr:DNA-3-methyladenine glycosylase 2 family protein [Gammaproteobacteria bacterium]